MQSSNTGTLGSISTRKAPNGMYRATLASASNWLYWIQFSQELLLQSFKILDVINQTNPPPSTGVGHSEAEIKTAR
jgi:hypothetical protein